MKMQQRAVILSRRDEAQEVVSLLLGPRLGESLLRFEPGAHIDVEVRPGIVRQYSIANDPAEADRYLLGVLREQNSRGGSVGVHQSFEVGIEVGISAPRNLFALEERARHTVLLAGGIGITPLLSMAYRLRSLGKSFELHMCCRAEARVPFRAQIGEFGAAAQIHIDGGPQEQRLDLERTFGNPQSDHHAYVCGPSGFIDHVCASAHRLGWSAANVHVERFSADPQLAGGSFDVVLAASGHTLHIPSNRTLADVLIEHGFPISVSCEKGICGTCLTPVLEGIPDHRDFYQTDEQKAANTHITPCCSRSVTARLVLEL